MHSTIKKVGSVISALTIGLVGFTAQASQISGAAFHAINGADAPFITMAIGAVTNTDTQLSRTVVADLGVFNSQGGAKVNGTISGVNNGGNLFCLVVKRHVASGNATQTQFQTFQNGNFTITANNVQFEFPGLNAVSLSCLLPPANANGQAYIWHASFGTSF